MNTNKETMNTNKDIINNLKHLSVPMGLYTIPKHQASYAKEKCREKVGMSNVSILNSLETSEVIADEIFEKMLDITTVHDKTKTRKNRKYLQSNDAEVDVETDAETEKETSKRNGKKEKRERKNTKKQRKSFVKGRRVTKKARK